MAFTRVRGAGGRFVGGITSSSVPGGITFVMSPSLLAQVKVDPQIGAMMATLGAEALQFAHDHAPEDTGDLKRSLTLEMVEGNTARVSVNVPYWYFPEYGLSSFKKNPQPYLRPALTAVGLKVT